MSLSIQLFQIIILKIRTNLSLSRICVDTQTAVFIFVLIYRYSSTVVKMNKIIILYLIGISRISNIR